MKNSVSFICFLLTLGGVQAQQPAGVAPAPETGAKLAGSTPAVALLDVNSWVKERTAQLAITERSYDPFGRPKDPVKVSAPPVATVQNPLDLNEDEEEPAPDPIAGFKSAVSALKVSMVGNNQFVVSGQTLREGQMVTLASGGVQYKSKIISVSSKAITIENTENGKQVTLKLSMMPEGMQSSGKGSTVPGMTPRRPQSEQPILELDR